MRKKQKRVYSTHYATDDKIIDWLNGIFYIYADVHDDGGKVSKSDIMSEADEYNIDPNAVEHVLKKHPQLFATTGPEYWFPKKKIRIPIDKEPDPEPKKSKRSWSGFFPPSNKPLSPNQEKRVVASAKKQMRAAPVE